MSGAIIEALCAAGGPFASPAHVMLREVRNKTGHSGGAERYADGIAVSVYPSRGIWFAGIEVKVSRSDWLRELKDPAKSEEIQKFCTYWWIATPPGIVKVDELPPTWGLIEVAPGGKCRRVKNAPVLTPEPPTVSFVASILRSADTARTAAFRRGVDSVHNQYTDAAARIRDAEGAKHNADRKVEQLTHDLDRMKESYADAMSIIELAGVKGEMWRLRYANDADKAEMARAIRRAVNLRDKRDELRKTAAAFRSCAGDLERAVEALAAVERDSSMEAAS